MATALQLDYLPIDQLTSQSASWWDTVLGVVGFEKAPSIGNAQVPVTASMTPELGSGSAVCEVWRVGGRQIKLSHGSAKDGGVTYKYCDDVLFGSISIDETLLERAQSAALLKAVETAYDEIFAVLRRTEHRHLIRVWNYLPEINRAADGDERYRLFNSARKAAFQNYGWPPSQSVPAACALGTPAGSPISIYFLASRRAPTMIENPRQISAYRYPPRYGVNSPIFSRACVLGEALGTNLFVSGTASIVGHESIHQGDVAAQTRETIANIEALLNETNRVMGSVRYALDGLKFKVYVRQPEDLDAIEGTLSKALRPSTSVVYVRADVCREDLLVEIEATGEFGGDAVQAC